ncbi:MAG: Sec-independent protein translocase protein TatB [Hyphomicrobiaceae bacterium]|nr:Sec-independent protein translocase protein TatB [Hyphomicrobiaceae bacterium]
MFEISWSELLILAVVTLIFVGPKDLPKFLNTLGRYAGMVRRQAAEFRAQFDEAMRQAELDALKKEVEDVRSGIQDAVRETQAPQQPSVTLTPAPQPTPAQPAAVPTPEAAPLQVTLPLGRTADEVKQSAAAQTEADETATRDAAKPGEPKGA